MKGRRWNGAALLLGSFFAPVFLFAAVMLFAHITPFGDQTLLMWDANYQYTAFLANWKRVLSGQADALYSFSHGLGGGMTGMIAYYLASPLNLLLLLPLSFPLLYSLLVLVKIGLCGLTFMVFLRKRAWSGLLFSTTYALSGFMAAYCFHVMWLDALILLPLVALGIRLIHEDKPPLLYILSLGMALLSQYYMGYMLCIFSVLYFLYHMHKWQWKTVGRFIASSLLAAGLAAVLLIPLYYTLSRGYALFDWSLLSWTRVNTLRDLLTKFYTAAVSTVQLRGNTPNYYVGIPMLVFVAIYLTNGGIPLGKRLRSLLFIALFVVSFWIAAPYYVWHAFDTPNFFPARFSFLFSFLLIELGFEGFEARQNPGKRPLVIFAVFAGVTFLLFRTLTVEYLAYKTIFFDVAACAATCGLLMLKKPRRLWLWLIILMQFTGLFCNSYYAYRRLSQIYTTEAGSYTAEVDATQAQVDRIQAADGSVCRIEKNFYRNDNDAFLYGYRGISHMSSDPDTSLIALCEAVGLYKGNYHIRYGSATTPVLDSLLGVKYLLSKDGVAFGALPDSYQALWTDDDVTAYENTSALPLAYLVPQQTLALTDTSPFINQNTLLSDLTGETVAVFAPVEDIARTYDGTWETYTFPVDANRPLYMTSFGSDYTLNGQAETEDRMNGTVLLPATDADTAYTVQMTAPLGIDLAYFDWDAFQSAQAILSAHAAAVESDTDSHLTITAAVTDGHTSCLSPSHTTRAGRCGWTVKRQKP
ncbi:MAG TPA: YfhO family protein [Candidatus Limiplasma sp.]|nr:YfhO family protein [Candidatus Limiplasma sp.]